MSSTITHVIFDWSGTLSDDLAPVNAAINIVMKKRGKPEMTLGEFKDRSESRLADLLKNLGIKISDEQCKREFEATYLHVSKNGTPPVMYEDAIPFLNYVKARHLSVLSAHPQFLVEDEAAMYGITDRFQLIVGGITNKAEGLLSLVKRLKISPTQAVYVCDTIGDVHSAMDAGISSLAVCRGYHKKGRFIIRPTFGLYNNLEEAISKRALD